MKQSVKQKNTENTVNVFWEQRNILKIAYLVFLDM